MCLCCSYLLPHTFFIYIECKWHHQAQYSFLGVSQMEWQNGIWAEPKGECRHNALILPKDLCWFVRIWLLGRWIPLETTRLWAEGFACSVKNMVLTQLGVRAAMKHPLSVYCSFGGTLCLFCHIWIFLTYLSVR